jgi:putative transposase
MVAAPAARRPSAPQIRAPQGGFEVNGRQFRNIVGGFKSFPVQEDDHFFTVCRYVERNPLRANLVARAQGWRWSSLWHRTHNTQVPWLSAWPLAATPDRWLDYVNGAETESELAALRRSVLRGAPYGEPVWQEQTAVALGLESALRRQGRPRKAPPDA